KWKDPFSKHAYTVRQRGYAGNLPGGQSYTPQMVIGGRSFAVGSQRRTVLSRIRDASQNDARQLTVQTSRAADGAIDVQIAGTVQAQASVWLVKVQNTAETKVRSGENKGKTLVSHNIVRQVDRVGVWTGKPVTVKLRNVDLAENHSCVILVQNDRMGPILGAARCPAGVNS
ncbi:MAG: DUF1223 domain-containing protein, partial [Proteobacteria bacterium]|nr:DUF1223 domain-containing protein [Pseudomonadota bacterium]